jgi:hypothetical protein
MVLLTVVITGLVISLALLSGCLSPAPGDNSSLKTTVTTNAIQGTKAPGPGGPGMNKEPLGSGNHPVAGSPEKLQIAINSATLYRTLPGFTIQEGSGISVINVSIRNNLAKEYRISREYLYIQTERGGTLEHGGDRMSSDMAGNYLRFPLTIGPGETKTGSLVYIVYYGTKTSDLVLKDSSNNATMVKVDLNKVYTYA